MNNEAIRLDPRNGVYVTGTRFAIATHEKHPGKLALLGASKRYGYSLVSWHDNGISLVTELVSLHVSHIKHRMNTVQDYLDTVNVIGKRCQTALNLLNPETYGGAVAC
ncbi:hypothetical protein FE392_10090 [Xenorhabdus sp. 12]|uniref:DUF5405 domain-containing protein n=1 Tax=Xenorhabdus santafensis TaxID=2582833 RepID=A0ABU4SA48_9GAMM|nr:DUF5405 family protein [Xenorhabdus sp. 12]MDX7987679.1 hypothetical protein [Xenorhabdus sp. 12]